MLVLENGQTLRQIRHKVKIPVKTLADCLGVSKRRIYAIENEDEISYTLVMRYLKACYQYDPQAAASEQ